METTSGFFITLRFFMENNLLDFHAIIMMKPQNESFKPTKLLPYGVML